MPLNPDLLRLFATIRKPGLPRVAAKVGLPPVRAVEQAAPELQLAITRSFGDHELAQPQTLRTPAFGSTEATKQLLAGGPGVSIVNHRYEGSAAI